ncbi:MAG: dihydropyrimidinase [bacterium]|nr:dihydropyrimidinase [bacterium]
MSKSLLIRNGRIVNADNECRADILVEDGKIIRVAGNLEKPFPETLVIDASGQILLPGGIDPHVHMDLPVGGGLVSADDFQSGSAAAIAGGTTSIIDFVTPQHGQSLIEALGRRKKEAQYSLCDYGLHMSITSWTPKTATEIEQCIRDEGIPSFKVYMAYKDAIGLDDRDLLSVMDVVGRCKGRVTVHCEFGEIVSYMQRRFISEGKTRPCYHPLSRPPEVESETVARSILMARMTQCPLYIVHVSAAGSVEVIAAARARGQDVLAETCPHYLLLDDSEYRRPDFQGAAYVMSPPLRPAAHKQLLWDALENDTLQTVATDHCPFNMKSGKDRGIDDFTKIPNGVAGVQSRMMLLYTYGVLENKISLKRWVELVSTAPAKIFGLYPRKGIIAEGADADIVLWPDMQERNVSVIQGRGVSATEKTISVKNLIGKCDTSIYEGFPIKGKPHTVIVGGTVRFSEGKIAEPETTGTYLRRNLT